MEPNGTTVPEFIQRFRPGFPVGWNYPADILNYLQIPVVSAGYVPKMAFIDREGMIRAQHGAGMTVDPYFERPGVTIRATLEELLKAAPKKAAPKKAAPTKKKALAK
jgi:hypothetical protein